MSTKEAAALADRLAAHGRSATAQQLTLIAEQMAALEIECRKASRLIRAMMRQVHSSDVFHLPPEA